MPKRLVICDVIGSGVKGDAYRAVVADYAPPIAYVAPVPADPVTGGPKFPRTLAMIGAQSGADLNPALNDPRVRAIPFGALEDPLSSFTTTERDQILAGASEFGLDTSGYTNSTLLGTVVQDVAHAIDPNFSIDRRDFDIAVPD